jgi:NADPH:quinone reductase-like Zn-dependent oxidoreductase
MKAVVIPKYGSPDVLQLVEMEKPVPSEEQVLVKILAASVNTADLTFTGRLAPLFLGFKKPKEPRLGTDVSGLVESIGTNVTSFRPGDEVFGFAPGSFAEYAVTREVNLAMKPVNVSFEQAASVPVAAITALQGLRDKGRIQPGHKVLVYGASGGVGTFTVQIAKSFGAEVTAVCSPHNIDIARSIGADHVIDYTREDFTRGNQRYDLILGINGYHPIFAYRRVLTPRGIYLMVGVSHDHIFQAFSQAFILAPILTKENGQKLGFMGIAKVNQPDLVVLKELLEAGKIAPVIDRRYPLSQAALALTYLLEGHARGKVILYPEPT